MNLSLRPIEDRDRHPRKSENRTDERCVKIPDLMKVVQLIKVAAL